MQLPLDENQIQKIAAKSEVLRGRFLGCFPLDRLPSNVSPSQCYIANLDYHNSEGSHWVAVYCSSENVFEYFDTFGRSPPDAFTSFYKNVIYNTAIIQGWTTETCGPFCLYFLIYRSRGFSMTEIVSFLCSKLNPDNFIKRFINKFY